MEKTSLCILNSFYQDLNLWSLMLLKFLLLLFFVHRNKQRNKTRGT